MSEKIFHLTIRISASGAGTKMHRICLLYKVTEPESKNRSDCVSEFNELKIDIAVQRILLQETSTCPPSFVVEPKSKIVVSKSSPLTIVCDINGTPSMKVTWLKDQRQLKITDRIRVEHDGLTYSLIILDTTVDDEGVYTVRAEDEYGKIEAHSQVVIREEETAITKTSVKIVKGPPGALEGKLQVENYSTDSVSLSWNTSTYASEYLVGQRTPDQQNWTEVATTTRPKCVVNNLQPNTEYLFSVIPKNAYGCGERSSAVLIKTKPTGFKPHFTEVPPSSLTVMNGHPVKIAAKFDGMPIPIVKWYKNNKEILESESKITIDKNTTTLSVPGARYGEDDVVYRCHIENELGQISVETTVIIMVDKEEVMEVDSASDSSDRITVGSETPFVAKPLTNVTVQSEQQFTLSCKITAKDCTVAWYRNDERITSTGRHEIISSSNGFQKLVCHVSSLEDSGIYRCIVTNEKGIAQSECEVVVKDVCDQVAPVFERELVDITALIGKSVVLSCRAIGQPEPALSWTKDGELIATSRRVKLMFDEHGVSELRILDLTAQDAGIYFCTATNSAGVQSSQCTLTVVEISGKDSHLILAEEAKAVKPRFIRAPPSTIDAQEGGQFKLIAKAVGDPRPIITWKKDGREVQRTNRLYKTYVTGDGESHLLVECVVSKTSGIFSCTAHNVHGEAETETQVIVHRGLAATPAAEKPDFSQHLKDLGVVTGHPVTLTCKEQATVFRLLASRKKFMKTLLTVQENAKNYGYSKYGRARFKQTTEVSELVINYFSYLKLFDMRCFHFSQVRGMPEPELKWYYIDDVGNVTCLTDDEHGWIECRGGEFQNIQVAELKADCVLRNQQGTYKCVATNEHGQASSQCYLLVGELKDEPAGPPRFLRCLRDIWTPLGEEVVFEVEVAGYPAPDLVWYHQDKRIVEGKSIKINYISETFCELRVSQVSLRDLGNYAVEASNVHGLVRTTCFLNAGEPRRSEPPQFQLVDAPEIAVQPKVAFREQVKKSATTVRAEKRRKGAPPVFVQGLEDMELEAGCSAAVAGKLARKIRHRQSENKPSKRARLEAREFAAAVVAGMNASEQLQRQSTEEQKPEIPAMDEIRSAIQLRNQHMCRPKFMVKPRPKKALEEFKSLRLKTAISANPTSNVYWDRDGVVLETGNKYSIYNDGDFYYLEVHHVSTVDQGFYNCTATNSEGIATCSSEVEVVKPAEDALVQQDKRKHKREMRAPAFVEVLPGKMKTKVGDSLSIECSVSGYPAPAIKWLRNGTPLLPHTQRTEKVRQVIKANDGERVELNAEIVQGSEPLQIRWIRNRVTITDSESFQYQRTGADVRLVIADAFPEDSGEYAVEARNQWGSARCIMRLDVHIKVAPGEEAELSAHVTGHPDPICNEGNSFSLRVKDVVRADGGKYSLTAVNVAGEAHAKFELMVTEPTSSSTMRPRFTHAPVSVQSRLGQRVELLARFVGTPPAVCRWFKGDVGLEDGVGGYSITDGADSSTLSVVFLANEHIGEYLCTVRNPYGEDLATAMIILEGKR
uniref:TITIN n=1 Tax=Angiostrongylus cantonensis TaxID=6313 RepID=A0A158PAH4_ANGCA